MASNNDIILYIYSKQYILNILNNIIYIKSCNLIISFSTLFDVIFNHADLIQRYSLQCYSHIFKCTLLYTFSSCILCQEIHLQISLSDPIPLDPPHCHSLSPSPLFFLSPSLESHMVSLKWSTIKRGAQGARCPHLFSCTA